MHTSLFDFSSFIFDKTICFSPENDCSSEKQMVKDGAERGDDIIYFCLSFHKGTRTLSWFFRYYRCSYQAHHPVHQ